MSRVESFNPPSRSDVKTYVKRCTTRHIQIGLAKPYTRPRPMETWPAADHEAQDGLLTINVLRLATS